MAFGYDDAAIALILAAELIYHRWFEDTPPIAPPDQVQIPTAQPGSIVPLSWGRYRINKPLLAWAGPPATVLCTDASFVTPLTSGYLYMLDQLFNVCIGFENGDHRLKAMWAGDIEIGHNGTPTNAGLAVLDGNGGGGDAPPFSGAMFVTSSFDATPNELTLGYVEFLNGGPTQTLVFDDLVTGSRWCGSAMLAAGVSGAEIPGYRGYVSVFLFNRSDFPINHWIFGSSSSIPTYAFEIASYATGDGIMGPDITDFYGQGIDSNPINVIYDVLTGKFGKLKMSRDRIHLPSFKAAAATLHSEALGYSMAYEAGTPAADIINDVLRHIDGIIYEDPSDGLIHIKLVRADYEPGTVRELRADAGVERIDSFASAGWTGLPNKLTISYADRSQSYVTNTVTGMGDANAAAIQDTEVSEQLVAYPGCCTLLGARTIANRELTARCRPIAKCQVICDQRWADVNPGDVLALTWAKLGLSRELFRVAAVSRGTAGDGKITLSLIQEFFQVYRDKPAHGAVVPPLGKSLG